MKKIMETIISLLVFLLIFNNDVYASDSKKKAIRAYQNLLNSSTIQWGKDYTVSTKNCSFAMAYIDKNIIPELIVYSKNVLHMQGHGHGKLYTYKNGKLKPIGTVQMDNHKFIYYKKKGIYLDSFILSGEDTSWELLKGGKTKLLFGQRKYVMNSDAIYYDSNRKEITKKQFSSLRNKYIGKGKKSKSKFHKVTKNNIKKYLK